MSNRIELTHKGWLGIAPVYFAEIDSDMPVIQARHWCFEWMLDLSFWVFDRSADLMEWMNRDYEFDGYPFQVTDELPRGVFLEFDND